MKNKIISIMEDKYFRLLSLIILVIALILYKDFILGSKYLIYKDIGSDTISSYWPFYKYIIESIKKGTLNFWSFQMGIGTSTLSLSSLIFDPFNIILFILPIKYLPYGFVLTMIAKIYVSGAVFYFYLKRLNVRGYAAVIGSVVWAFNGYILLWGQHYMFASAVALFTLIMYSLEVFINDSKCELFIGSIFLLAIHSPYIMYAVTAYLFLYAIGRYFYLESGNIKRTFIKLFSLALRYLSGLCLGAVIFIPSCFIILSSPRLKGAGSQLPDVLWNDFSIWTIVTRLFSNNLTGNGNSYFGYFNYYEAMMLSSSIIILLMIPQLFMLVNTRKKKFLLGYSLMLTVIAVVSPLVSYFFNAFSTVATRWSFVIIFTMIVGGVLALNTLFEDKKMSYPLLVIQLILCSGLIVIALSKVLSLADKDVAFPIRTFGYMQCIMLIGILIVTGTLLILYKVIKRNSIIWGLIIIVAAELILNNYYTINKRDTIGNDYIQGQKEYYDGTIDVVEEIKQRDKDFYRIEKNYQSRFLNDPVFQGYRGLSNYGLNTASSIEFASEFENLRKNNHPNYIYNFDNVKRIQSLLGVKYILSKEKYVYDGYNKIDEINGIGIYQNSYVFPLGYTYESYIPRNKFEKLDIYSKEDTLLNNIVLEDDNLVLNEGEAYRYKLIKAVDISFENLEEISNRGLEQIYYRVKAQDARLSMSFDKPIQNGLILEMVVEAQQDSKGQLYYKNLGAEEKKVIEFDVTEGTKKYLIPVEVSGISEISIALGSQNETIKMIDIAIKERSNIKSALDNKDIFNITKFKNSKIEGNIEVKDYKIITWTVPYDKGWTVKVDGNRVPVLKVNTGFIGVEIQPGYHDIELSYMPYGMILGAILSIGMLILCIIKKIIERMR